MLDVSGTEFTARLTNLADGHSEDDPGDLEAVFALEEVSRADRASIQPGAIFYWNVGYYDDPSGQRHRVSDIRFRRIPAWYARELELAAREAELIRAELGIE